MHADSFTGIRRWGLHCEDVFSQPLMAKIVLNRRVCLDGAEVAPTPLTETSFLKKLALGLKTPIRER